MNPSTLQIHESRQNGVVVVSIRGRLDAQTAPALEQRVLALIADGDDRFVFDLADLRYISSSGLRVFLMANNRLRRRPGRLVLAGLQEPVHRIFDLAGFDQIIEMYPDTPAAMRGMV